MTDQIQSLAHFLAGKGIKHAFGIAGSGSSMQLITMLEDNGIKYYPASHEAAAAIMSGTAGRVAGQIAVSITIKGPGLANMLPGIIYNKFETNPAISISEAFGKETPSYRKHKRLDHSALLSSVVKGIATLSTDMDQLDDLFNTACQEVPGPVHFDLCQANIGDDHLQGKTSSLGVSDVKEDLFLQALELIYNTKRPVLIVGSLASRRQWGQGLAHLDIPVFTTAAAKGVFDERLANSAGVYTGDGKELAPEISLIQEADLVVGIGLRNSEVLGPKPFGKPTILIDEIRGDLADGFQPSLLLAPANPESIYRLLDELANKHWGVEEIAGLKTRMKETLFTENWLPAYCFEQLNLLSFDYGMVMDTGFFCTVGEHLWDAGPQRPYLGSSIARYLGVGIPTAIGFAIGKPEVPIVCIVGDGGIRMYISELKLAVEENLPICFILMSDGRYGSVAYVSLSNKPVSQRAVNVPLPSWWKVIDAMGISSHRVDSVKSFASALQSWGGKGACFIEAAFEPESYSRMCLKLR